VPELVPARVENEDVISVPTLLDLDGWLRSHDRSRPAVIHGSKHFSYGEFVDLVDAARGAIGGAGVVAVVMDRSIELVAAVHAVVGSGSVYLPIDPALPDERIRATLSDGGADLVLTDVANLPRIDGIRTVLPTEWKATSGGVERRVEPTDTAAIIYTSGSTGSPKGAMVAHQGLANQMMWLQDRFGLQPDDRALFAISISFDASLIQMLWPLYAGAQVVVTDQSRERDIDYVVDVIQTHGVTHVNMVPSLLRAVANRPGFMGCRTLRMIQAGGEPLHQDLVDTILTKLPHVSMSNVYGPTEASIGVTEQPCRAGAPFGVVPIGRPTTNVEISILDSDDEPVAPGGIGEICVSGIQVARGYHGRPDLTAEAFFVGALGWTYRTGDVGRWLEDGSIAFEGRLDDQVKVRGTRIELGEIEAALVRQPGVAEAAAAVSDHGIVAVVVSSGVDIGQLRERLKSSLPAAAVPSVVVGVEQLPRLPNAKIDRSAVVALCSRAAKSEAGGHDTPSALMAKLRAIWEDALERPVGLRDDFFDVGGHSLLAAEVMDRIEREIVGSRIPLAELFAAPTIAQLAAVIEAKEFSWRSLVPIEPDREGVPFFFVHAHGGNVVGFRDLALHMTRPFYGLQAADLNATAPQRRSIESMASDYVEEVLTVSPTGPYLLGGFCLGAAIALEMGRILTERGEDVAAVVMVDLARPGLEATYDRSPVRDRLRREWANLVERRPGRRLRYVRRRLSEVIGRGLLTVEKAGGGGASPSARFREEMVADALSEAYEAYVPEAYGGPVVVVRAAAAPHSRSQDATLGWGSVLAGQVETVEAPGHQTGLLARPRVRELARIIEDALAHR